MATIVRGMTEEDLRAAIGLWLAKEGYPDHSTYTAEMRMSGEGYLKLVTIEVTIDTADPPPAPTGEL